MKHFLLENIIIKLGQNKKENWELLDNSNDNFIWLHLDKFPSGYVIIEDSSPNETVIKYAAEICKSHTKYRNFKNLSISITTINNLQKGENIGEVFFKSNKKVKKYKI